MSEALNEECLVKVACLLQDLTRFLRDTSQKRRPARDHDICGGYIPATIATAAKSASYYMPQLNEATGVLHDAIAELAALKAGQGGAITEVSAETFSSDGTSDIITCNLPIGTKLYLSAPPAPADAVSVPRELLERTIWNLLYGSARDNSDELRALLAQSESKVKP